MPCDTLPILSESSEDLMNTIADILKRKLKIEKRSPIKNPPLRSAGQSVDEEIQKILYDKMDYYAFAIGVSASMAFWEWYHWYFKSPPQPVVMTILALLISIFSFWKILEHRAKIRNLRQARDGEKAVGQYLERLREKGYQIFHDVIGNGFNVDHVLVGPAGVFSVETKTISKPEKGQSKVSYDGEKITIDGFTPDRDPIVQAKAQANWLQGMINESTGKAIPVRPVVLYPGWFISRQPKGVEVWVLEPKAIPAFLDHEKTALNEQDIKLVAYHLSRYVREKAK
jgi:hypothetical protein